MFRICWTETVTLIVKSSTQKFTTDYCKHLVGSMVGIRLQDWPSLAWYKQSFIYETIPGLRLCRFW